MAAVSALALARRATGEDQIPAKTVVLTFDDAVKSHRTFVAPLLKDLNFRATFFVTHLWMDDAANFMTWREIAEIHRLGFEIGNHAWTHGNFSTPRGASHLAGELALTQNELAGQMARTTGRREVSVRPGVIADFKPEPVDLGNFAPRHEIRSVVHPQMSHKEGGSKVQILQQRRHEGPVRFHGIVESENHRLRGNLIRADRNRQTGRRGYELPPALDEFHRSRILQAAGVAVS